MWAGRQRQYLVLVFLLLVGIFCLRYSTAFSEYCEYYEYCEYRGYDRYDGYGGHETDLFGKAFSLFYPVSVCSQKGKQQEISDSRIIKIFPLFRSYLGNKGEREENEFFDPSYEEYRRLIGLYEEISMRNGMGEETGERMEREPQTGWKSGAQTESWNETQTESQNESWNEAQTESQNELWNEVQNGSQNQGENMAEIAGQRAGESVSSHAAGALGWQLPYSMEQLADYDFLIQKVYNVHSSTTAPRDVMCAETFLAKDFSIEKREGKPQILIYHSHSQETYRDGNSVVDLGGILKEKLEKKGYSVIHDKSVYDLKDGKLDRSKAYTYALEGVQKNLAEYPSIEVVIDLHRDGVAENIHLVSEVDGRQTAQLMFFNGMSQTPAGEISYLENPYREDNLAFSFQLQMRAMVKYAGLMRKVYLKGLRYNLHVRPRSLLIEAGAQTNTFEEAQNAMEPLADILSEVLGTD